MLFLTLEPDLDNANVGKICNYILNLAAYLNWYVAFLFEKR